jgi:hypothetical protein
MGAGIRPEIAIVTIQLLAALRAGRAKHLLKHHQIDRERFERVMRGIGRTAKIN